MSADSFTLSLRQELQQQQAPHDCGSGHSAVVECDLCKARTLRPVEWDGDGWKLKTRYKCGECGDSEDYTMLEASCARCGSPAF